MPLYSTPIPGVNSPLYSNSSLSGNGGLLGAANNGEGEKTNGSAGNTGVQTCKGVIPLGEWLLYPSITLASEYSDNLFLSPSSPVNAWGFGATPKLTATWTNGIHTTTIYATSALSVFHR